ncbi:hypothetical protein NQZ68_021111 [Dissostichus eleginoides]|nr:hypothetical protein NQZ68_021111 [Dissostichus eleginoides]
MVMDEASADEPQNAGYHLCSETRLTDCGTLWWNGRSCECKPRRHQRLVGRRYFQMASPFLAVTTWGRMDSLKHL